MSERTLLVAARDAEDTATGLRSFRDALPAESTGITSIISKLYDLSSLFTRLDNASQHPQYAPSFFRIKREIFHVMLSSRATTRLALDAFGRTRTMSYARVWDDLRYRMGTTEGVTFHERLDWYRDLLTICIRILKELPCPDSEAVHAEIVELLHAQQAVPGQFVQSPTGAPPAFGFADMPTSPSSDGQHSSHPWAPEPPPLSPTYTSSSGHTINSSQTSYSAVGYNFSPVSAVSPVSKHWARAVFDAKYPGTRFRKGHQSFEDTRCEAPNLPDALERLQQENFVRALELQFEDGTKWVRLYHRETDDRARILFISSKTVMHSAPLTQLIAKRDKSCLKLCRVWHDGHRHRLMPWAILNFATYERMCLFYSTFVAMKRQDSSETPGKVLTEQDELNEEPVFARRIRSNDLIHSLKLFKDEGSGVLRLEASPWRGPMAGVPLWTAFITTFKLKNDLHWADYVGNGLVSLAALKPHPYVFLKEYKPLSSGKEYLLQFADPRDGKDFVTTWVGLCNRSN